MGAAAARALNCWWMGGKANRSQRGLSSEAASNDSCDHSRGDNAFCAVDCVIFAGFWGCDEKGKNHE